MVDIADEVDPLCDMLVDAGKLSAAEDGLPGEARLEDRLGLEAEGEGSGEIVDCVECKVKGFSCKEGVSQSASKASFGGAVLVLLRVLPTLEDAASSLATEELRIDAGVPDRLPFVGVCFFESESLRCI